MFRLLLSCALVFHITTFAETIVTKVSSWSDIAKYITPEHKTYILTDLDDTLLRPVEYIGSTAWFVEKWNEYKAYGHHDAIDLAIKDLAHVYEFIDFELTESYVCISLEYARNHNVIIHGLTARSYHLSEITHKHCRQVGLCFDAINAHCDVPERQNPVGHHEGIIFCGNTPKGVVARHIALQWDKQEKIHVIFIDDSEKHVHSVVTLLDGIVDKITGIHYCPHKTH